MPHPLPHVALLASLLGAACQSPTPERSLARNLGIELSEDPAVDRALATAIEDLLDQADRGHFGPDRVAPEELHRNAFFWDGMLATRRSRRPDTIVHRPLVLKSFSFDERDYHVTLSYHGERAGERFLRKIVQVRAVRSGDSYRFECVFDERTAAMDATVIDDVTFRHRGAIDRDKADRFVAFRRTFSEGTDAAPPPLAYYRFASLERLLHAYGVEFDCAKCNFLSNDLGFGDDSGARFVTGMGHAGNIRDYVYAHLRFFCPEPERMFRAVKEGIAVCYGKTWGGVSVDEMKAKFRRELDKRPDLDFLAEFQKARKSSVDSHFTHYFLCALLCNELLPERLGDALKLLYSGANGERFFDELRELLGIDEQNFHSSIVRLLHQ